MECPKCKQQVFYYGYAMNYFNCCEVCLSEQLELSADEFDTEE